MATLATAGTPPLPILNTNLVFDVTNTMFAGGALGDGSSNCAAAIQAAINTISTNVVAGATGGTVRVPFVPGITNIYLSGPINLASHVNLQIDSNAMLQMLPMSSWSNASTPFINAGTITDSEISGKGTIDGQGAAWWGPPTAGTRPNFIIYQGSTRVLIQDVTLQNPPTFHIMVHNNNKFLTIQNIRINTSSSSPNTDGIDLASTNVLIQGCTISDGDDNIQIGSSAALASDITITNCHFGTGHGLSIGSPTQSGINNLTVSNCWWNGTEYGIKIKTDRGIGGVVQNLTYRDLTMSNVNFVIAFYMYYNELGSPSSKIDVSPFMASTDTVQNVGTLTPIYRNITISNVTATANNGSIAGIIWGLPESLVSNVTLCKVNISAPTKTFCVYNAQGITIVDSNLSAPNTSTNTLTIYRALMTVTNTTTNSTLVTLGGLAKPPTNNVLAFFNGQAATTDTNLDGAGSITVGGSTLSFTQASVTFSNSPLNVVAGSTLVFTQGTNTFTGALTGSAPLTVSLTNANIMAVLQGSLSNFTGTLTITNSGTLRFDQGANAWGDASAAFAAGATGTINNHSAGSITISLGALSGGAGSTLRGSDQSGPGVDTYLVGSLNSNTTFAGTITNGTGASSPHLVALVETGTGSFTLSGANSYGGGTTVSNGTLLVNNTTGSGTGTGAVTVVAGATLGGSGAIAGPVTINGTLSPGSAGGGIGTLTINNNLVVNGGASLSYALGTNSDLTAVNGNLTLGGTLSVTDAGGFTNSTYRLFNYGGTLTYNGLTIGTTPNPGFTYTISTNTAGQVNLVVANTGMPPVANFTAGPTVGPVPLTVNFTDTSTGTIGSVSWTFGDGGTTNFSAPTNVAYTYATPGVYTVTLVDSGSADASTNTQTNLITAMDPYGWWASNYFGCAACPQAAPDADPLGKGMSNSNQFLVGLDPTNPASVFQVTSAVQTNGGFLIAWKTAGIRTNVVQGAVGTAAGYSNNFSDISAGIIISVVGDATTNYTDGSGTNQFYRIRLGP